MKSTAFTKVMRIGTLARTGYKHLRDDLFCKAEISDSGELSIIGVVGPTPDGNSAGGCVQINMEFAHRNPNHNDHRTSSPIAPKAIEFAQGWNAGLWLKFLEIWHRWHLNHMKSNCEHQIGPDWTPRDVTLYHFRLRPEITKEQSNIKEAAVSSIKAGRAFTPTPRQLAVMAMEYAYTHHEEALPAGIAEYYEPKTPLYNGDLGATETKATNWLRPDKHPDGYLCKPCPVCGYRYGSQWRKEALPQTVVDFLRSLPDADKAPAWI